MHYQTAGTAAHTNQISVGVVGGTADLVPLNSANLPATTAVGETYSTSKGGANAWSFRAAGGGNVDSDGVAFLSPGQQLIFTVTGNVANAPHVIFFARLAPVAGKDVFA